MDTVHAVLSILELIHLPFVLFFEISMINHFVNLAHISNASVSLTSADYLFSLFAIHHYFKMSNT